MIYHLTIALAAGASLFLFRGKLKKFFKKIERLFQLLETGVAIYNTYSAMVDGLRAQRDPETTTWKNLAHTLKTNPLRSIYRLLPAMVSLKRFTTNGKMTDLALGLGGVSSFIVDHYPKSDIEAIQDFSMMVASKIETVKEFFMSYQPPNVFESDDHTKYLKILGFAIAVVGGAMLPRNELYERFCKGMDQASKNVKNVDILAKNFEEMFCADEEETEVRECLNKIEDTLRDYRGSSFADKVARKDEIPNLLKEAGRVIQRAERNRRLRGSQAVRSLSREIEKLGDLEVGLKTAMDYRSSIRPHPVCLNIVGTHGAGKTTFVREVLIKELSKRLSFTKPVAENTYTNDPASQHFPGYVDQKFFVADEFLAQQMNEPLLLSFNALATDQATLINGAAIEFKNMRPQHEFLFTISNYNKLNHLPQDPNTAFVDAFNSRLNNLYVHFKEYNGKETRPSGERTLCVHRVSTSVTVSKDHKKCPERTELSKEQRLENLYDDLVTEWKKHNKDYIRRLKEFDEAQDVHEAGQTYRIECPEHLCQELAETITLHNKEASVFHGLNHYGLNNAEAEYTLLVGSGWGEEKDIEIGQFQDPVDFVNSLNAYLGYDELLYQKRELTPQAVFIKGTDSETVTRSLMANGIEMTPERRKVVRLGFESQRPLVVSHMVHTIDEAADYQEIYFVDLGVAFKRTELSGRNVYMASLTPKGIALAMMGRYPKTFLRMVYDRMFTTSMEFTSGVVYGPTAAMSAIIQVISYLMWAFVMYRAIKLVAGYFTKGKPDQEDEESMESAPSEVTLTPETVKERIENNTRIIAHILSDYKLKDNGEIEHQSGGGNWIYDEGIRTWVRMRDADPDQIRTHAFKRAFGHESTDPGIVARKKTKRTENFESAQNDVAPKPVADYVVSLNVQGKNGDEKILNSLIRTLRSGDTELETVIDKLSAAKVLVSNKENFLFGIAIKDNYVLVPAHIGTGKALRVTRNNVIYAAKVYHRRPEADLMMLEITDPTYPWAKNIMNLFVSEKDIFSINSGALVLPGTGKNVHVQWGHVVWDLEGSLGTCEQFTQNVVKLYWPSRTKITRPGFCGSPFILNHPSLGHSLTAGMHSFASAQNYSGIILVTREILDNIFNSHEFAKRPITEVDFHGYRVAADVVGTFTNANTKAQDPFPENDRIELVGTYGGAYLPQVMTTEFERVPKPLVAEIIKSPSVVSNKQLPATTVEKLKKDPYGRPSRAFDQLHKMVIKEKSFSEDIAERLVTEFTQHYMDLAEDGEIRVLSNHEVVNGVSKGPLQNVKGLNMKNSPGYTLKKLYNVKKKGDLYDLDGTYVPRKCEATRYLYSYVDYVEKGGRTLYWPSIATPKDELLPDHKIKGEGKIRMFSNNDMMQLFLDKKYFGWCMGFAHNHLHEFHATVGMRPLEDFNDLYMALNKHPKIFTGDYSKWDKRLPRQIMQLGCRVLANVTKAYFSPNEARIAEELLEHMVDRLEIIDGHVMSIKGSMSSGIWLTNFLNSLCNSLIRVGCIMAEFKDQGEKMPHLQEILLNITMRDHGDDEITSVSEAYSKHVNYFTMKEQKAKLGMLVTPATKDGVERAFEPIKETSFISRYPKRIGNRIVGALKKESIEQQLQYQRPMEASERMLNLESLLFEACVWNDAKYYDKLRRCVIENAKVWRLNYTTVPTFEEAREVVLVRSGQYAQTDVELLAGETLRARMAEYHAPGEAKDEERKENDHERLIKDSQNITRHTTNDHTSNMFPLWLENKEEKFLTSLTKRALEMAPKGTIVVYLDENMKQVEYPTHDQMQSAVSDLEKFGDINVTQHMLDVEDHRRQINENGQVLFGKTYPEHDLSKFCRDEAYGYQLLHFHEIKGILWTYALWHHYAANEHHVQHKYLPSWDDWIRGDRDIGQPEIDQDMLEEMLCDAAACIERKMKGSSLEERVRFLKDDCGKDESPSVKWPKQVQTDFWNLCDSVLSNNLSPKVPCYSVAGLEFTNFKKALNYSINSENAKKCFKCNEDIKSKHAKDCDYWRIAQCSLCTLQNDDPAKIVAHYHNNHKHREGGEPPFKWIKNTFESGKKEPLQSAAMVAPRLEPLNGPTVQKSTVLASQGTVPAAASMLPGYVAVLHELTKEYAEIGYYTVPSSQTRGDLITKFGYGEIESMNPASQTMAGFHRYIMGNMELSVTVYGAANKTGSILMGWVPDINAEYTLNDVYQYGNWVSLAITSQATSTISLANADTVMRPREIIKVGDTTTLRPGVVFLMEEPVANALGTGETQVSFQVKSKLAPNCEFTYVELGNLGATGLTSRGNSFNTRTLQDIVGAEGLTYLAVDGNYVNSKYTVERGHFDLPVGGGWRTLTTSENAAAVTNNCLLRRDDLLEIGWVEGILDINTWDPKTLVDGNYDCDYLGTMTANQLQDKFTITHATWAYDRGATFRGVASFTSDLTTPNETQLEAYQRGMRVDNVITSFTEVNGFPTKRHPAGLKRFTLQDRKLPIPFVNEEIATRYPTIGETRLERDLKKYLRSLTTGDQNLLVSMSQQGFPVGEIIYDNQDDVMWINIPQDYAFQSVSLADIAITSVSPVSRATTPAPFTRTAFINRAIQPGGTTRHEASAAVVAMMAASIDTTVNTATGLINGGLQRKWQRRENERQREFQEKMFGASSAFNWNMATHEAALQNMMADYSANLGVETASRLLSLQNRNMVSKKAPGSNERHRGVTRPLPEEIYDVLNRGQTFGNPDEAPPFAGRTSNVKNRHLYGDTDRNGRAFVNEPATPARPAPSTTEPEFDEEAAAKSQTELEQAIAESETDSQSSLGTSQESLAEEETQDETEKDNCPLRDCDHGDLRDTEYNDPNNDMTVQSFNDGRTIRV